MKNAIAAALLAAVVATGASAADNKSYQLLDINGDPLCEVLNLTQHKSGIADGVLAGACGQKDAVGGLYGNVHKVSGGPSWTVVLRETKFDAEAQYVIVLNEKNLTWTAFSQKDGTLVYSFLSQGTLEDVSGPPPARGTMRSLTSLLKDAPPKTPAKPPESIEVHYTFAQSNGTPYCDGLTLTQDHKLAQGIHTVAAACEGGEFAGGNRGYVKAFGEKVWIVVTTSAEAPGTDFMFVLDENAMTWVMYGQQSGGTPFQLLGNGILLQGDPQSPARTSTVRAVSK